MEGQIMRGLHIKMKLLFKLKTEILRHGTVWMNPEDVSKPDTKGLHLHEVSGRFRLTQLAPGEGGIGQEHGWTYCAQI